MTIDEILSEAETKMGRSAEALQRDLTAIRTGRANPALIDRVMVPAYGTMTPLNQVAQISAPEARMLLVQVYDRSQVAVIEKALRAPELGLNPASDGSVIRVPIPALTEERRREYVKMVSQAGEEARVSIRNVRRDEVQHLETAAKEGSLSEDDVRRAKERMQKITDSHTALIEQMVARKETEVLEI